MPDDFCSVLGFFPTRSESPVSGCRGHESLQRHRRLAQHNKYFLCILKCIFVRSRTAATAAFLTLSRYVSHQRWIWSIQVARSIFSYKMSSNNFRKL